MWLFLISGTYSYFIDDLGSEYIYYHLFSNTGLHQIRVFNQPLIALFVVKVAIAYMDFMLNPTSSKENV